MARRTILTGRQRSALFSLPQHEADLLRHYTLSDEDLQHIEARRRPRNKLGFALQLCVLRYPGRLLAPGEFIPPAVVDFIGRQLDFDGYELADYAVRSETRHEHLAELRRLYGTRESSRCRRPRWRLAQAAMAHRDTLVPVLCSPAGWAGLSPQAGRGPGTGATPLRRSR